MEPGTKAFDLRPSCGIDSLRRANASVLDLKLRRQKRLETDSGSVALDINGEEDGLIQTNLMTFWVENCLFEVKVL